MAENQEIIKAILDGEPINLFNEGRMKRDFTFIDDIVDGILKVANSVPTALPANIPASVSVTSVLAVEAARDNVSSRTRLKPAPQ